MLHLIYSLILLIVFSGSAQALSKGEIAPSFSLRDAEGKSFYLSDHIGKKAKHKTKGLVLSFFASYCQPCKRELPVLNGLTDEFRRKGIEVIIVGYQEDFDVISDFLKRINVDTPLILSDRYGTVGRKYGVKFLPMTFFINRDGKVKDIIRGEVDNIENVLRNKFEKLLRIQ